MELSWLMHQPALIKVLIFFLIWVGIWLPIAVVSAILLNWHPTQPLTPQQKIVLLASLYLIAPVLLVGMTHLEQTTFLDYGLWVSGEVAISIGFGLMLGGLSLGLLYTVMWKLGATDWQQPLKGETQPLNVGSILSVGLVAFWISITEELVFRGFLQFQLHQDYSVWVASAIVSTIFALSHLLWNWQGTIPQLPGLWLMGMVLTIARFCDRGSLGLPIGLHAAWIWGITLTEQRFITSPTTRLPGWLVGESDQPLASLSSWVMLLMLAGVLLQLH
ncbi:MAG: type II CAAX endopeptidase family protein [Microcoleaceae cyanobacterium]